MIVRINPVFLIVILFFIASNRSLSSRKTEIKFPGKPIYKGIKKQENTATLFILAKIIGIKARSKK